MTLTTQYLHTPAQKVQRAQHHTLSRRNGNKQVTIHDHHPRTQQYKFLPITSQAKAASSVKIPGGMDIVRQYECLGDSILGTLEDNYCKAKLAELLDLIREYLVQAAVSMAITVRNVCKAANLADLSYLIRRSCSMLSIGRERG